MKRILKITGAGCLTVVIVGAVLLAFNWDRISSITQDLGALLDGAETAESLRSVDALLDFIDADRSRVSLVAYRLDAPDAAILLNPDVPRPLASTIKILVLAGYAQAVDQGRWSPDERVPLTDVEAFFLPDTDGGAHDRAVEIYRERGWLDASGSVALRQVVWAMMTVSDNAATDYLLNRLGRERAELLAARFDAADSDAPLPISGVYLAWAGADQGPLSDSAWELAGRLRDDPEFRAVWQDTPVLNQVSLREQLRLSATRFPTGTARDYAGLMERVQRGDLISGTASAAMREYLEWPMANEPIAREFAAYGTKGGSLPGVLTEATYAVPRNHASGAVAALFLNELPPAVWLTLQDSYLHQDFLRRLLADAEFFETIRQRLDAPAAAG